MVEHDEPLVVTPVPALVDILLAMEREKGSRLTEAEVTETRDRAVCIMLPLSERAAMDEARGYADVDPEKAWEQWQAIRQHHSEDG